MKYCSDTTYQLLIHSSKWSKIRTRYIKEHPLCECCGKLATEVHHKIPLTKYRDDAQLMEQMAFTDDNLMSVCSECHLKLHIELGKYKNQDRQAANKERVANFLKNYLE